MIEQALALRLIDLQDALGGQYGVLSRPKLRLMVKLSSKEPVSVSDLAVRLHISSPAVSQMIDKLAADGLVMRSPMNGDQRLVGVRLSDAGDRACADALMAFQDRVQKIMQPLSTDEQQQFMRLLTKMGQVT